MEAVRMAVIIRLLSRVRLGINRLVDNKIKDKRKKIKAFTIIKRECPEGRFSFFISFETTFKIQPGT